MHRLQFEAPEESMALYCGHTWWNGDTCQATTFSEGACTNAGDTIGNGDVGQSATVVEGIAANAGDTLWDDKVGNLLFVKVEVMGIKKGIGAATKTFILEFNTTPGSKIDDVHSGQTGAVLECVIIHADNASGNGNAG
jgi:hypothetical protein